MGGDNAPEANLLGAYLAYKELDSNEKIVLVCCFSQHRKNSFEACEFIMNYLKKDAPFWKNEFYYADDAWLENSS